jgi:hypothetical protein
MYRNKNIDYRDVQSIERLKSEIKSFVELNDIKKYYKKFIDMIDYIEKIEKDFQKV